MLDKSNLEIIYSKHAWNARYMEELGYRLTNPYLFNKMPFRLIREVWFRIKLLPHDVFYNKECLKDGKTLIVFESLITAEFLEWLHKKCLDSRIILLFTNKVGSYVRPDQVKGEWCEMWTADKDDSRKYGINLLNGGGYMPQWKVDKSDKEYDVFFVGKDKNRLAKLENIENVFRKQGLSTFFYITWEKSWQRKDDGVHKRFISYDKVLEYIGKSKAILHLVDGAQNGVTLRIMESLIHRVKLITDDVSIVNYDFYNPDNIFILGKDEMSSLKDFIDKPYIDVKSEFFNHAYFDDMIEEVISK